MSHGEIVLLFQVLDDCNSVTQKKMYRVWKLLLIIFMVFDNLFSIIKMVNDSLIFFIADKYNVS